MGAGLTRVLLDTHALLWWLQGSPSMGPTARSTLGRPELEVHVSAASGWEIATKHRIGKLPLPPGFLTAFPRLVADQRFQVLEIGMLHAVRAGALESPHRDPFDRMIAAQALIEGLPVMSADEALDGFGVRRVDPRV